MINPAMMLLQAMNSGGNPAAVMQSIMQQSPQANQLAQMMQGKNPAQLRDMAMQLAQQRGVNIQTVANSLGLKLPR